MIREQEIAVFCQNVKLLRVSRGLNQKEMAKLLGIGVQSLRQVEHGVLPPRLSCDIVFHLHQKFGLSPSEQFQPLYAQKKF